MVQAFRTAKWRQFTFNHHVPQKPWHSFDRPRWKAESTTEPPSGFEHGTPGLVIQHPNDNITAYLHEQGFLIYIIKFLPKSFSSTTYFFQNAQYFYIFYITNFNFYCLYQFSDHTILHKWKNILMPIKSRGVYRTLSNIYGGALWCKNSYLLLIVNYF